jgi:hypothetical protein
MSELIKKHDDCSTIRWKLMASVSAAALIASCIAAAKALASDDDSRPTVWIELGTQLEGSSGGDAPFASHLYDRLDPSLTSPAKFQSELPWAIGPEAKLSFRPAGSDWTVSASVRYGRATSKRSTQERTNPSPLSKVGKYYNSTGAYVCCTTKPVTPHILEFADTQAKHQESYLIVDFQVGKDVGLGFLGRDSSSVFNAGIRFAQFISKSSVSVKARSDIHHYNYIAAFYPYFLSLYPQKYGPGTGFKTFSVAAQSKRSFQAVGPSISWDASATIAGRADEARLTFDWGVNASLLFGKQKARTHHESSAHDVPYKIRPYQLTYTNQGNRTGSRNVAVPNIGGMAGFSIRFPNAKVSLGYRADFFFGAMDTGSDVRSTSDVSFHGPFATISIGLGG